MASKGEIVYVLSDVRSGSTLLDQLLGAHPAIVSVGELHWLRAYLAKDRRIYDPVHPLVCSCGQAVSECAFWTSVQVAAERPLDSFRFQPRFFTWNKRGTGGSSLRDRIEDLPMRMVRRAPSLYKNPFVHSLFGGPALGRDSVALCDAILAATGKDLVVDSSKSAYKFWSVYRQQPDKVRVLIMARDYRAVVYSKMQRGQSLEGAALGWRRKMEQIDLFTLGVARDRCYRLKYESLCSDPSGELAAICAFLNIEFDERMLRRPTEDVHHIGGSPSKFDSSKRKISLDKRYEDAFDRESLEQMRRVVGSTANPWAY